MGTIVSPVTYRTPVEMVFYYGGLVMNKDKVVIFLSIAITVITFFGCSNDKKAAMGAEGGACYGNKTCDEGLTCEDDVCIGPEEGKTGEKNGPCYGNSTCNPGLTCVSKICILNSTIGTGDSSVVSDSGRDSGTGDTGSGRDSGTGDATTSSCNGVTCSGYGTCVSNNGRATCNCNSGYHADSLNCVADEYGVIMGKVSDATDSSPIGSAAITYSGTTVNTNEQGFFSISDAVAETVLSLNVTADGYASTVKNVTVRTGLSTYFTVNMLKVTTQASIDVASGGSITGDGATVTFQPNSINASGTVSASLTTLKADDALDLSAFPGEFLSDNDEVIESFGAIGVELKDASGNLVNLLDNQTADISIPVPYGADATIPLWSLDTASGRWIEEGSLAGCDDGTCEGTIPHLSWWNADKVMQTTCANICVETVDGDPAQGVSVQATGSDYYGSSQCTTGSDGCCCMNLKSDSSATVVAFYSAGIAGPTTISTSSAGKQCGSSDCVELTTPLVVTPPVFQATLTWGEQPYDVDSHFTGPCDSTDTSCLGRFHVYYSSPGSLSATPWAYLDTDDRDSYGPEIVSLAKCVAGVYRYSIHNFSGSPGLETSEAVVNILLPDGTSQMYNVPTTTPSTYVWVVGDLTCTGSTGVASSACDCTWSAVNEWSADNSYDPPTS
jgi:hypothetical protein